MPVLRIYRLGGSHFGAIHIAREALHVCLRFPQCGPRSIEIAPELGISVLSLFDGRLRVPQLTWQAFGGALKIGNTGARTLPERYSARCALLLLGLVSVNARAS